MFRSRYSSRPVVPAVALGCLMLLLLCACNGPFSRGSLQLDLTTDPNPPVITPTTFTVTVKDAQGQPVDSARVMATAVAQDNGSQRPGGTLVAGGNGAYTMSSTSPAFGNWKVSVTASKEGYDTVTQEFDMISIHPAP